MTSLWMGLGEGSWHEVMVSYFGQPGLMTNAAGLQANYG
jgi:hypothetical protein